MGAVPKWETRAGGSARSPTLARWGGASACLAGVSYGAVGYLHDPDAPRVVMDVVVPVLGVATPALFFGGLVGLYSRLGEGSLPQKAGLIAGLFGTLVGVFDGLEAVPQTFPFPYAQDWWSLLFAGLTVMGLVALADKARRSLGALVLASGTLGWISLLTDPESTVVLAASQPVHAAFAAAFCASAIVWGWVLFRRLR